MALEIVMHLCFKNGNHTMKLRISDSQGPFTCFNTFKLFPSIQICIHQLIKQKSNAYFGLQKIIKVWNEYCFCQILDHRRQRTKYSKGAIRICITSTQMTDVTWAPIFTTHAVDNPFPKTAARPSWLNQCRKRTSFKDRYIPSLNDTANTTLQLMWKSRKDKCKEKSWWHYRKLFESYNGTEKKLKQKTMLKEVLQMITFFCPLKQSYENLSCIKHLLWIYNKYWVNTRFILDK